jgi:LiaI-LiaF-like transmembrane region
MNCATHLEVAAQANCETCYQPFCSICLVEKEGKYYCSRCLSEANRSPQNGIVPEGLSKPGTAFGLGLIPGVGAICNGEYFKAFVHVVIFGFLISISSSNQVGSFEPLFGLLISAFYFYMPLEAYQTAKRKILEARGVLVPVPRRSPKSETLLMGLVLILLGLVFFLNTLVPVAINAILKLWPVLLIIFGAQRIWMSVKQETAREDKS